MSDIKYHTIYIVYNIYQSTENLVTMQMEKMTCS